jgi:hypothetical protein
MTMAPTVEDGKRWTGRECGDCSLCCKLLNIDVPELKKPKGVWCSHCKPGKGGCSIYDARPDICHGFACGWLVNPALDEAWKPSRAKIVVNYEIGRDGRFGCHFVVDPAVPNRWREAPWYGGIKQTALNGLNGTRGPQFGTYVNIKDQMLLVLPRKEIDVTDRAHLAFKTGDHALAWDAQCFDSEEQGRRRSKE